MTRMTPSPDEDASLRERSTPIGRRRTPARATPVLGLAGALLLAATVAVSGEQPAAAQTAPRITGRYVVSESTLINSVDEKPHSAECDDGDQGWAVVAAPSRWHRPSRR
jgi:hypothetical protein